MYLLDIKRYSIFLLLFLFYYLSKAQTPLDIPINLHLREKSYEQVLLKITDITSLTFVYNPSVLPKGKTSLIVNNQPLKLALEKLFQDTYIIYVLHKNEVILKLDERKYNFKFTISGYVKDKKTGEKLPGVSIGIENTWKGTFTNEYGFYSLNLTRGQYKLLYSYLGYEKIYQEIQISRDTTMHIAMKEKNKKLKEVIIKSIPKQDAFFNISEKGAITIYPKAIDQIPLFLGERDLIKSFQFLPGIQASVEGNAGVVVRGGTIGQNLILLDEVPLYNTTHLFGFFSVFNPDIIRNVSLYKGNIPARYSGRLSSVLDVRTKEGNKYERKWTGGIGTFSGKLTFETPINNSKGSIIFSGRRTYLDLLLGLFNIDLKDDAVNNFFFQDIYIKGTYQLGKRNKIHALGYYGRDKIGFQADLKNIWDSYAYSLNWVCMINAKLFSNTTFFRSHILSKNIDLFFPRLGNETKYKLESNGIKEDFNWYIQPGTSVDFGFKAIYQNYLFNEVLPFGEKSIVRKRKGNRIIGLESGIYASLTHAISSKLHIDLGLHLSRFDNIGPAEKYLYNIDEVISPETSQDNITDTIQYNSGNFYHTYQGFEPRFRLKILPNKSNSVKFSYDLTRQYIHRFANANIAFPGDIWAPVNPYIKPQLAHILSLSYNHSFFNNIYSFSLEGYYKFMDGQLDIKPLTNIPISDHIETEVLQGIAKSYGVEWLLKKNKGKFTGWLSYAYLKANRIIEGINEGKPYPPLFDKRHNFSFVCSYNISPKINISATWIYSSGAPFSVPQGKYEISGIIIPHYQFRNNFRLPNTHRLDLSISFFRKKTKQNKNNKSNFNISIYNVYNRKNVFAYVFGPNNNNDTEIKELYFAGIIPSLTYNFKF